jgi:diacylglycerol kinase family enzyme
MSVGEQAHLSGWPELPITASRRWWARGALLVATIALLTPFILTGFDSLALLAVLVVALGVIAACLWLVLSHRGALRIVGLVVAALAVLGIVVLFIVARVWWIIALAVGLWLLAGLMARTALRGSERMHEYEVDAPRAPFLIMNPRSGGGKVARFGLVAKAEALGARVALLDTSENVDVVALAQGAVADGADLLGVAGGDGTQALVAGVAAEHGIPLVVIAAGTRNHFALDLGLDRDDPSHCLDALSDGVELHIDLGTANGRPFVNNASFGAYAAMVQSPEYRADKARTALQMLPDLLVGQAGARLSVEAGDLRIEAPQAVLVSNNQYGSGDLADAGRRFRLDRGVLGVLGVRVDSALQAAGLLRGASAVGMTVASAKEATVMADASTIPVGIDGEALMLHTPVHCTIHPGALRVRVPRNRPGRASRPPLDWHRVRRMAGGLIRGAGLRSVDPRVGGRPS